MRFFRDSSFRMKIMATYVLLILIPLIIMTAYTNNQAKKNITDKIQLLCEQQVSQDKQKINEILDKIRYISMNVAVDSEIRWFLQGISSYNEIQITEKIINIVNPKFDIYKAIDPVVGYRFFVENSQYPRVEIFQPIKVWKDTEWYKNMYEATRLYGYYWESSHVKRNYFQTYTMEDTTVVCSLFLPVRLSNHSDISYEVEISVSKLLQSLSLHPVGDIGERLVIDNNGEILLNTKDEVFSAIADDDEFMSMVSSEEDGVYKKKIDDTNYFINYAYINRLGVHIVNILPEDIDINISASSNIDLIMIAGTTFLALILIAVFLGRILSSNIHKLSEVMKLFQMGDFSARVSIKKQNTKDEFTILSNAFNSMAQHVEELVNTVYVSRLAQREAELAALQSQINPHFFSNVIEAIKMQAVLNNQDTISEGLTSLSHLYRKYTHTQLHFVKMEEELEMIKDYVAVQNLIHNEKINISYKIDVDIQTVEILNFVLQPIVENSIVHSFDDEKGHLNIYLSIQEADGMINCSIIDDGIGMEEGRLNELCDFIEKGDILSNPNFGLAIVNINKRLNLYYNFNYKFEIKSKREKGSAITISYPLKQMQGDKS